MLTARPISVSHIMDRPRVHEEFLDFPFSSLRPSELLGELNVIEDNIASRENRKSVSVPVAWDLKVDVDFWCKETIFEVLCFEESDWK